MNTALAARWHAEFAVQAAVAGAVALAVVLAVRRPRWALGAASLAAIIALVPERASGWVVLGVAVLAVGGGRSGRAGRLLALAGLGALLLDLRAEGGTVVLVVGASGLLLLAADRSLPGRLPAPAMGAVFLVVGGALWLCVPDTEEVLVITGSVAVSIVAGAVSAAVGRTGAARLLAGSWLAPFTALAWGAGHGFRGRPAGSVAVVAVTAMVACWPLVDRRLLRRTASDGPVRWPWAAATALVVAAAAAVVARSAGLQHQVGGSTRAVAASLLAVAAWWTAVSLASSRRSGSPS